MPLPAEVRLVSLAMAEKSAVKSLMLMLTAPALAGAEAMADGAVVGAIAVGAGVLVAAVDEQPATIAATAMIEVTNFLVSKRASSIWVN